MLRECVCVFSVVLVVALTAGTAAPQVTADYGDAPEGTAVVAYPSTGVPGGFPTCVGVGPAQWIQHTPTPPNWAFFGPTEDYELDGNAGACPSFAVYDLDECFADGDAGLMFPDPYTIVNVPPPMVVPCVNPGPPLGFTCTTATWGIDVDIHVTNSFTWRGYVNVLMDWNQDGVWAGSSNCPGIGLAPEHVLVDWIVDPPYSGPLSGLAPPPFLIGPNPGYVWTRFSITEQMVGAGWNGAGMFEGGESEDYLLRVDLWTPVAPGTWGCIKALYR